MTKSNKKSKTTTEKERDYTPVRRALFIVLFSGSLATGIYLAILVSSPDKGQLVLAGSAFANAVYHLFQAIK